MSEGDRHQQPEIRGRKFRQADPVFKAIETLYGVGYRFAEE